MVSTGSKISLVGTQESINSIFFLKNNSIFARKQGDFIAGYEAIQNTVYGVNGPSFNNFSSYNTAIGYQSFNNNVTKAQTYNVVVGNGASYDATCSESIIIGAKAISKDTNAKSYDKSINVGASTNIGSTNESVHIGNSIISSLEKRTEQNVVIGAKNKSYNSQAIIVGYDNSNSGTKSIIIGQSVKNTGSNSLLIYPKYLDGEDTAFVNNKDNYVNIFGIITGSNNKLNIGQGIDFSDNVEFKSSILIKDSVEVTSNMIVNNTLNILNTLNTRSNNSQFLDVASNAYFKTDIHVRSNIYTSNIYSSNIDAVSISIDDTIFMNNSNLSDLFNELYNSNANFESDINRNLIAINDLSNFTSNLNNRLFQLSNHIVNNTSTNNSSNNSTEINPEIMDIVYINSNDIADLKSKTLDLEFAFEDKIDSKFDAIIRNEDNKYSINIVRDSMANFPAFDGSYSSLSEARFDPPSQPNLLNLLYPFNIWNNALNDIKDYNITEVNGLQAPGVILHDSNIFNTKSFFNDEVMMSNSVSFGSNVYIKGAIKSYGNYVTINDSLLVYDALHVGDFIETNALKVDYSFNNFIQCYSNLRFSQDWTIYTDSSLLSNLVFDGTNPESEVLFNNKVSFNDTLQCYSNLAFPNDWSIFTRENTNNSNLKDLVFKGTIDGSIGVETTFTDFIPGALNFTGQHRCTFNDDNVLTDDDDLSGYIVSSTGIYSDLDDKERIHIDDAIPVVCLSQKAYDKRVFGVISSHEDKVFPDTDNRRCFQIGTLQFKTDKKKNSKKLIINSVGEGGIWVCNQNGNIYNGDLIVSSDRPGYGMKQDDDIIRNYTVAKATCDALFYNSDMLFIGCVYKM